VKRRGNTLAASLVVVVIIMIAVVVYITGGFGGKKSTLAGEPQTGRADGHGTTALGAARWAAKDDVCRENLSQIRQFIQVAETSGDDDKPPASLDDIKVPQSIRFCPIGKEAYDYDPATGKVHCPHPGHEKF
jgi:hypothetical protein